MRLGKNAEAVVRGEEEGATGLENSQSFVAHFDAALDVLENRIRNNCLKGPVTKRQRFRVGAYKRNRYVVFLEPLLPHHQPAERYVDARHLLVLRGGRDRHPCSPTAKVQQSLSADIRISRLEFL